MKFNLLAIIIGLSLFTLGCDPSYRIRRDNEMLNDAASFDCLKAAIEKVLELKLISDEILNEPFAFKGDKKARQIKYLSAGETILVTSCYAESKLKSFSQYQSGLPGEWKSKNISPVAAIMLKVENSIERHCHVKDLSAGMKMDCRRQDCGE